jgi:hypothetical protein
MRLLTKKNVKEIAKHLRMSVLPQIEREYGEASDYVLGPKDRAGTKVRICGGGEHSDPTGSTMVDQEGNVEELRRLGKKIEALARDADAILTRLKGLFDAGASYGGRSDGHIPSAEEVHQRQQAVRAQAKRALQAEEVQLGRRLKVIRDTLRRFDANPAPH